MKLLILTQKVDINDDILGFFHYWIEKLAEKFESIIVICLKKGEYNLPKNVEILSLGKENNRSKIKYLWNFYKYIFLYRKNYDYVFVHMNEQYIILGWPLWKLLNKKIGLWYAHGSVPFTLRISEKLVDIIFTSTKSGFRVPSKKVNIVGQGIDINKFKSQILNLKTNESFKIISVGRISPSKDYETLIKAVEILVKNGIKLQVDIIGGPGVREDENYFEKIKKMVSEKKLDGIIKFAGSLPNKDIILHLQSADLFVNMGLTGSLDKAILEAMACGIPVLTCNEALLEVLGEYKEKLMYEKENFQQLAEKIAFVRGLSPEERDKIGADLRTMVVKNHTLEGLVEKIVKLL